MGEQITGRLIAFEGADASGKSTQARRLGGLLNLEVTFQFGATEVGGAIRSIILEPGNDHIDDRTEALLIIADKAQHVAEIVAPALRRGETIISDRYTASTLAYQGYARGLDLDLLRRFMEFATHGIEPDLTVLLDVDVDVARLRLGDEIDRIEGAGTDFHQRVRNGYLDLAAADPSRWVVIDACGTVEEVGDRVFAAIKGWLVTQP